MKKKLSVVTAAALLASMAFSMTACTESNTDVLLQTAKGSYSATVTKLNFEGSKTYYRGIYYPTPGSSYTDTYTTRNEQNYSVSASDSAGTLVIKHDTLNYDSRSYYENNGTTNTNYKLFDLASNQFTGVSSSDAIRNISNGLFYSAYTNEYNYNSSTYYTLYTPSSTINSSLYGTVQDGMFIEDGNRYTYTDYNGNVKTESDPFNRILKEGAEVDLETSNYYVVNDGNQVYSLFQKSNAEYLYSIDVARLANVSIEASYTNIWNVGDKIFFQTKYELPEDSDKYDYSKDGRKYDFDTYSYDLSDYAEQKEKPEFVEEDLDFVVEEVGDCAPEFVTLAVSSIDDNYMLSETFVQTYNESGSVYVDIQALVPGAVSCYSTAKYLYVADMSGMVYVYDGEECINTFNTNITASLSGGCEFNGGMTLKINDTLYIYNEKFDRTNTVNYVTEYGTTNDGNLWYKTRSRNSDTVYLYAYSVNGGERSITSWANNPAEQNNNHYDYTEYVGMYDDYVITKYVDWNSYYNSYGSWTYESTTTYSVNFLANVTDPGFSGYDSAASVGEYSANDGHTTYNVFCLGRKNGSTDSYTWTYTYYTVTCTNPAYEFVKAEK